MELECLFLTVLFIYPLISDEKHINNVYVVSNVKILNASFGEIDMVYRELLLLASVPLRWS